jgi:hypothetical protein
MILGPTLERTRAWDGSSHATVSEFLPPLCRPRSAAPSPEWPRAKVSEFTRSGSNMWPARTPPPGFAPRSARRGRSRAAKPKHAAEPGFASGWTTPDRRPPFACRRSRSSRAERRPSSIGVAVGGNGRNQRRRRPTDRLLAMNGVAAARIRKRSAITRLGRLPDARRTTSAIAFLRRRRRIRYAAPTTRPAPIAASTVARAGRKRVAKRRWRLRSSSATSPESVFRV